MIPVEILGLHVDPQGGSPVVLLGEGNGINRVLPIFIGPLEATSIVVGLDPEGPPRPLTHDLLLGIVEALDGAITEVRVTDLVDGTFHAEISVSSAAGTFSVSSRPSDGLALAARLDIAVLVSERVLDEAAVVVEHEPAEGFDDDEIEDIMASFHTFLEHATPEDFAEHRRPAEDESETGDDAEPSSE